MNIQPNIAFTARVKISEINKLSEGLLQSSISTSASSGLGSTTASSLGSTASEIGGSAANILGTAFSAKASGADSFGIVPSSIDLITPYVTPKTILTTNNHPSAVGSFFSTIGNILNNVKKVNITSKVKDPS